MLTRRPPLVSLSNGPYESSGEHLRDEMARLDLLVRAQVVRWRVTIGEDKPPHFWGMVHVNDREIERYLDADIQAPDRLPEELVDTLRYFWNAAEEAERRIQAAVDKTLPSVHLRVRTLCGIFGLSPLERDVLLICLMPETDFRYRRVFAYLQDDASRSRPSVELLAQILHPRAQTIEAARALLEPGRPLLSKHLVVFGPSDEGRPMRAIRLDDRIASYLLGLDEPDARLKGILSARGFAVNWDQLFFDDEMMARLRRLAEWARKTSEGGTLLFHGPYGSGRWKSACAVCTAAGINLIRVNVEAALREPARWEFIVDLCYREAALQHAAIYWDGIQHLFQEEQSAPRWEYLLEAASDFVGLTFLAATSPSEASARFRDSQFLRIDFPVPPYELRKKIWQAYLPPSTPLDAADSLAMGFQLTEGQILDAIAAARSLARKRDVMVPVIQRDDLYEACRRQSGRRLIAFARRIEPRQQLSLDDVVLPEPNKRQLLELRNRIRLRGRLFAEMGFDRMTLGKGLLALFVGGSGMGKTMSAELLASEQHVDLYKIDLSAVVSKWVGETEKNLGRVFSEAEDANAMLFFDECDALFGQRGQIKEAKDRWANLEVNYLLQRVEEYSGVVIMATNLRQNIDDAFMRRIQVIVEFPSPDADLRFVIWKRTIPPPPRSEVSDGEIHDLADTFTLSGGSVRNVVIDAAFRAYADDSPVIKLRHLVDSIAREYQKLGRPITHGDFGDPFFSWVMADILAPASTA